MATTMTMSALHQHNIDVTTTAQLVNSVRRFVTTNRIAKVHQFIYDLTGTSTKLPHHPIKLVQFCQQVALSLYKGESTTCTVIDAANTYVTKKSENPDNSWMYVLPEGEMTTETKVLESGLEVEVTVNHTGKPKRGAKQLVVAELYKHHVVNGTVQMSRDDMIAIIMKEADMTIKGAGTYYQNARKEFGDPNQIIVSKRKTKQ